MGKNTAPLTVTTAEAYADAFRNHQPVVIPPQARLLGRIARGKSAGDFRRLAADDRRLVFMMGREGLQLLPGKPAREALRLIGLMHDYVEGRIKEGNMFKLHVFEASDPKPATWDNVIRTAIKAYPEIAADIRHHRGALPRQHITRAVDEIDLAGPQHPAYLSLARYRALPEADRRDDPMLLRRLFAHEIHLGPDYAGDGRTRSPGDGVRAMTEYVIPNADVSRLRNAQLLDIHL